MVMRRYFDEQIAHLNEQMIAMGGMVDVLHSQARVLNLEYTAEGIRVEAVCDGALFGKLKNYLA